MSLRRGRQYYDEEEDNNSSDNLSFATASGRDSESGSESGSDSGSDSGSESGSASSSEGSSASEASSGSQVSSRDGESYASSQEECKEERFAPVEATVPAFAINIQSQSPHPNPARAQVVRMSSAGGQSQHSMFSPSALHSWNRVMSSAVIVSSSPTRLVRSQWAENNEAGVEPGSSNPMQQAGEASRRKAAMQGNGSKGARVGDENGPARGEHEYAVVNDHMIIFTPLIVLACLLLFLWEMWVNDWAIEPFADNPSFGPSVDTLISCGARDTDLIVEEGEGWRLISAFFLHAGVLHYAFNMFGFYNLGVMIERTYGAWVLCLVYMVSGLFSTVTSALFLPHTITVGASGAIFGVFGAVWADLFQNWGIYTNKCSTVTMLLLMTAANIILGLLPFLDQFAHLGGLVMGFFMGSMLCCMQREDSLGNPIKIGHVHRFLQLAGIVGAVVLLIGGLAMLYGGERPGNTCDWCSKLSCQEIPREDPWWKCDDCSIMGFSATFFNNGTTSLTCPSGELLFTEQCEGAKIDELTRCCISACL